MKLRILSGIAFILVMLMTNVVIGQTDGNDFEFIVKSPSSAAGTYTWGGTTDFGPAITKSLCGELVWAEDGETEGCESITKDLSDKIALIRRGTCDFSLKIWNAQQAGAKAVVIVGHDQDPNGEGALVGMLAGDNADDVTIPAIFISYTSGLTIVPAVEAGTVEVCFEILSFYSTFGPYSYSTPQSQIVPMENMSVVVINQSNEDKIGVETKLQITNPLGEVQEIVSVDDIPGDGQAYLIEFDAYTPKEIGEYEMKYISGLEDKEVNRKFEITENTFATDDGVITRGIGPDSTTFADAEYFYQFGSLVVPGKSEMATHVSFGLANGAELFTGDANADIVLIAIYNADNNGDGAIDIADQGVLDFQPFGDPIEIGIYELTGNETINDVISVALDNPLLLEEGNLYYVSVAYDAIEAGTGIAPEFAATASVDYPRILVTALDLDALYTGFENASLVCRLHVEGFSSVVEHNKPLSADKLKILSNPIQNRRLAFELNLTEPSDKIDVLIRNLEGKLIEHMEYADRSNLSEQVDLKGMPSGTYFLNVITSEGFRSMKFIIAD
ncbi:T9SS type A sorting domain-containing protein [Portibacter lacus]|uniref:PA domain-containing protein n=1 Tax=Portibacter lacus TaxID=1099794 RepID=A0AA37WDV5_9BACT|nr:T9SS type A sorting domain-containing protein [Portibacter lacus]GLR15540.1 hypothetical protein GCM10007940_01550 [Portibacter lacus]